MSEIAPAAATAEEVPLPHWVPALLSFVAGYVDVYTFLVLFGLFVAQVTGSFVTAGAELVTHDVGITGKAIAILAFLFAAVVLSIWEVRGGPKWRTPVVVAGCAVFALLFTSLRVVS